ncbi:hypothetical protein NE237_025806 [Protea cynaroides]|uniref:Uncharacterized protein n=1 Tax=Protea cynaroides TaxID=273540 RepID=A0A9Q0H3Q4_9MAGN|nr:hypothetical protein NE237_025806 [Protea cynaroides]
MKLRSPLMLEQSFIFPKLRSPDECQSTASILPVPTLIALDFSVLPLIAPDPSSSVQASPIRTIEKQITTVLDARPRSSPYWRKWNVKDIDNGGKVYTGEAKEESDRRDTKSDTKVAESKRRVAEVEGRATKAKKRAADFEAPLRVTEQKLQEVESDALYNLRYEIAAPTFCKALHLLYDYVLKTAREDFDISGFEFNVDAPTDSDEAEDAPDQQVESITVQQVEEALVEHEEEVVAEESPGVKQLLLKS